MSRGLAEELQGVVEGDVADDAATRSRFSRDASLFEVTPAVVVFPRSAEDVAALVRFVAEKKAARPGLSLTARAAGTDMTGGPLSESVVLDFTKYCNEIREVGEGYAVAEPGVFYRDFERATLEKGYLMPSYPASRELCALGGMVGNDAGGEKSLVYGKTHDYVAKLKVVLRDGTEHVIRPLTKSELEQKMNERNFEGELYRSVYELLEKNYDTVQRARPRVSKNSSGYNLWDVWNKETFDLTKLFTGSQGTLGITTEITFRLVKPKPHSGMLVIFMKDPSPLATIIHTVLPFSPTSFESFDDHTLRLALKFFTGFLKLLGVRSLASLALKFLPEFWMILTSGMPKLVLLVDFEEETPDAVSKKLGELEEKLAPFPVTCRRAATAAAAQKYWAIRRESFNLLRHKVKNMQTAPFIDDLVVNPDRLPEFLPKLYSILDRYGLLYTIAGHVGNGNFHIIPLMTLAREEERKKIPVAAAEVFDLVLQYDGSLTGEHNDGLIRGSYLEKMFGKEVYGLFRAVKHIFDPDNIFNPGKKVGVDLAYALAHLKRS